MAYLQLKDVTFKYPNEFSAVENVSMSFELGEKVAIVGQNGAGKTTTVKMMNGLLKPTLGDVLINGESTKGFTTAQISKKVGYVFQNPDDQIFHSNILSEIKFGPKVLGFSPEKEKEMLELAIGLTELHDYLDENPYNVPLSLRKFITIAAVIAMDSDVLIFDEPTAGQDFDGVKKLSNLIDKLIEMGKTVITITHDMEFVVNNFDRVIVMAHKNVLADSDVRDVFWQLDLLEESMLKQPSISQVAHRINLESKVLNVDEMVSEISKVKVKTS
ncbi:energy-coupling factor ABC transporter ATP-binding protein [Lederbergia citrea]|uniref:energy-coupling factor ABC transporter ATP-binding protein n=1 Tax=Lederbergia citrea TaxID=2833581 RepID=UPI001BC96744|nr:ABC transporter ATP-binding protein [Lederbergia citrea]MBS4177796.1 ABC transporter ATP-binding protein [Lederbergia citrea]